MIPLYAATPRKAAIYVRVSTGEQTVQNQLDELRELAGARGFEVVEVFEEVCSAAKKRPRFEAMMTAAKRGKFKILLVWALDRFGRSMLGNMSDVVELDRVGVQLISVRETWLDTSGPVRSLLIAIFSWAAELERARLIERTLAGLARARRDGKQLGRPRVVLDVPRARRLRAEGRSIRDVARVLGVSSSVLARALTVPKTSSSEPPEPAGIGGSS